MQLIAKTYTSAYAVILLELLIVIECFRLDAHAKLSPNSETVVGLTNFLILLLLEYNP